MALAQSALVVGFSIHGLAVARALALQGVQVHCLADSHVPPYPTTHTRYAKVHSRPSLNTAPMATYLLDLADEIGSPHKIVLFPTSDRIVKAIGAAWEQLQARYLLSWSHCRELVLKLQRKDSIAECCELAGVRYPRTRDILSPSDVDASVAGLQFPLVIKPAQPLSSFKAIKIGAVSELRRYISQYAADLPFVVQEWIEGPEPSLYSCTTLLDRGAPLFMFTSRKIAASPPGTGQGTVFETIDNSEIREISAQFLRHMDLSGPVAVEFKRDAEGRFWLIEPNVGRTEYCVDLAIQSGFNLPYLEYLKATGAASMPSLPTQHQECAWFDTDKDIACFLANLRMLRAESGERRKIVFPYVGHDDWRPLAASFVQRVGYYFRAAGNRATRSFRRAPL